MSLQLCDPKIIVESWQLLLLSYFRRSDETNNSDDVYNIFAEIENLIKKLPASAVDAQRHVLIEFTLGYNDFIKYDYRNALQHFQSITPSRLISACLAECQRLILLCHIQLAENLENIVQSANELYNTIESFGNLENEQYCRAALVLLDAYIDRSSNSTKVNNLKNKILRIIQKHIGTPIFDEFEACYNRKAALYYAAVIAYKQTEQSVHFYKNHFNKKGTYMALCNHSGNAIVSGRYDVARAAIEECNSMIDSCNSWYYPSQYKIINNKILLDYLAEEKDAKGNREKILKAANKATKLFSKVIDCQHDEVSHVALFNYIGLSMLCQTNTCEKELSDANNLLPNLDEFYQYYLYDLNYARALLNGEPKEAKNWLGKLKSLDVPLLRHYKTILQKRQSTQENLLINVNTIIRDPFEYHNIVQTTCNHIQDNSCYFWGRGFLLSDLQFLSF